MECFAYLRVSGVGQVSGHGFTRQKETIQSWANENGFDVVSWFKELGVSGTLGVEDRPAFQDMVSAILENGVKTVLVESLDRLARAYSIQEQILVYLASKNISLISANTGENITGAISQDPMKRALIQIQSVFAELEKNLLVRKLKRSREAVKKERGKCEGRRKWGEGFDEQAERERVIKKKMSYLRRKDRSTGKRRTYEEIANVLNESGFRQRNGGKFTGNRVYQILRGKR